MTMLARQNYLLSCNKFFYFIYTDDEGKLVFILGSMMIINTS